MLDYLRRLLQIDLVNIAQIAEASGIDQSVLRRFTNGASVPDAMEIESLAQYFKLELRPSIVSNLLPLERDASRGIQRLYDMQFSDAQFVLSMALSLIGIKADGSGQLDQIKKPRGLSWPVVNLVLGLYTKALKHFRAAISLCEIGLAEDANIVIRAMFETTLAIHFILRPRVTLKENGKKISGAKGKGELKCPKCKHVLISAKPGLKLKSSGTLMRAKLYMAYSAIASDKELKAYKEHNLKVPPEILALEKDIEKSANEARKMIGEGWVARQEKGYSGLSVRDLAASYKLFDYYMKVYRHQSNIVHGVNATAYISLNKGLELNLGPNPQGVDTALFLATAHMAGTMDVFNRRLGLGYDAGIYSLMRILREKGKH